MRLLSGRAFTSGRGASPYTITFCRSDLLHLLPGRAVVAAAAGRLRPAPDALARVWAVAAGSAWLGSSTKKFPVEHKIVYRAVAHKGVGGFVGGPLPAYSPVTELSGFLSFQFSG